jgi:peptidoglycan biosynthesis protein MviN/MurJ (putative lipid II flippase)
MDERTRNEMQQDPWRFIIIGIFLYQIFYVFVKGNIPIGRLPFRYFALAAVASFAVNAILYFTIRQWPKRRKKWVMWLIGFVWIGVALLYGRG